MHIINGLGFGYLHLLFNEVCINNVTQEKKYAAFDWIGRLKTRMNTILNNYLAIDHLLCLVWLGILGELVE